MRVVVVWGSPPHDFKLRFLGLCAVNREMYQDPFQNCVTSGFDYLEALMNLPSAETGSAAYFCPCRSSGIKFWRFCKYRVAIASNREHRTHKIILVGRYVWRSSPTPARADCTSFGCLGPDHVCFEYFQGWRFHSLPGQPFPVFDHPRGNGVFFPGI